MADWSKLAKYMPTGIFLTFQSLVTITVHDTADNKDTPRCNRAEFWVTMALLAIMAALSILVAFTDSVTTEMEGGQKTTYYGLVLRDGLWSPTLNYYCRLSHTTEEADPERATLLPNGTSSACPLCRQSQRDRSKRQKQEAAKEESKRKEQEAAEKSPTQQAAVQERAEGQKHAQPQPNAQPGGTQPGPSGQKLDPAAEPANLHDIREFVLKEARYKRNSSDWMHAVLTCACPSTSVALASAVHENMLLSGRAAFYGGLHLTLLCLLTSIQSSYGMDLCLQCGVLGTGDGNCL